MKDYTKLIAETMRTALDEQGIELTWHELRYAANAVEDALADVFESAHCHDDLANS